MKKIITLIILISMILLVASCGKKAEQTETVEPTVATHVSGSPVSIAGVTFTPTENWVDVGPSGMRKASYYLTAVEGDVDSATVTVFYFGPSGGGTIEANLDRWITQMSQSDGSDSHNVSKMNEMDVDSMTAHTLEVPGLFAAGGMMGTPELKENYLMVGVVLEAPEGNLFFKLTGPENTAKAMADELIEMVKLIKKN